MLAATKLLTVSAEPVRHSFAVYAEAISQGEMSGYGTSFALIVVLFILLIIVGTAFVGGY